MTVVGFLLATLLAADPPDDVRSRMEQWIRQLDSASLAERSRAEQELLDLGPRILPWLPPKDLVKSAAVREAIQRIEVQLQKRLAQESVRPSRVTLNGDHRLADVLAAITQQTGNAVRVDGNLPEADAAERDWSFDRIPFWTAIDEICRVLPLSPASRPDSDGLWLIPANKESAPIAVAHQGVLRAEILSAIRQPITGDPTRSLIRLRGELAFEPRLRPLFVHFKAGDFQATNVSGKQLSSWNPEARYELPMAGASRRTQLTWDFVSPTDEAPKSLTLKGKVLVQLAAATEAIRFDRLETEREVLRRRGGVSVRMHQTEFDKSDDGQSAARVKISVSYDTGGPAFESHRTWVYHNAAWLEADGRRIPFNDFDTLRQGDGNVRLEYRFQNLPPRDSLKFVYEAPTMLLDVPFEMEFDEVPVAQNSPRSS